MSQNDEQITKYKELYALSVDVLREEDLRHMNIENKASRYWPVITALFGGFAYFSEKLISTLFPLNSYYKFYVTTLLIILLTSIVTASYFFVTIQKQQNYQTRPVDIEFFDNNELPAIYRTLAEKNSDAVKANRKINNAKSAKLHWGHILVILAFSVLFLLFINHVWNQTNCHLGN
ncbi:MAG: hypothetical protein QG657_2299 [Acidobacteriota bacterium]|nr:hypothetical protein [Acidobacteriota bacterium]